MGGGGEVLPNVVLAFGASFEVNRVQVEGNGLVLGEFSLPYKLIKRWISNTSLRALQRFFEGRSFVFD
jgi:hypothetical protein